MFTWLSYLVFKIKRRSCDQHHIPSCCTEHSILAERDLYGSIHRIGLDCSIDVDYTLRGLRSSNRPKIAQANLPRLSLSAILPKPRIGVLRAHQKAVLELWANGSVHCANSRCEVISSQLLRNEVESSFSTTEKSMPCLCARSSYVERSTPMPTLREQSRRC
jgi:hypothetical protein